MLLLSVKSLDHGISSALIITTVVVTLLQNFSQPAMSQAKARKPSNNSAQKSTSPQKQAEAKAILKLIDEIKQEKSTGPYLSNKDIHKLYSRNWLFKSKLTPDQLALLTSEQLAKLKRVREFESPKHKRSDLCSPASLVGPISLGPAYGTLMFQNSLNQMSYWSGPALPWNGAIGSRYLLSSGPLTIPYELALQNRFEMTTITNAYGNQLVTLTDNATGYFRQYEIIGRLDASPPRGTGNPIYATGYYVSTYTGHILGTNTSSFPGVFVPYQPFETTFGYQGDLDTFGPFGRGHTPLHPAGPPPIPSSNQFYP